MEIGICDRIIKEPNGGAHRDFEAACNSLKEVLSEELDMLLKINKNDFLKNRISKYDKLGFFEEL